METLMEQEEECTVTEEMLDISQLCRVCANPNEYLIPIFHGEGLEHDLKSKVSRHLPLQIRESDSLPVQLCYQCASTLIAWSDLVEGCSEADEKLRSMLPEGAQAEVTLDDKTGLPINEESFGLQSSAVSAKVLHAETSEAVANAEVIVEPDVSSMDEEAGAIEPAQQRFPNPLYFYRQIQTVLKEKSLKPNGALFCIHCGQIELNFLELMNHMNVKHKKTCRNCQGSFVNEIQLRAHKTIHHMFQGEKNCGSENCSQPTKPKTRSMQLGTKQKYPLKKALVNEYMNQQSNVGRRHETEKIQESDENEEAAEVCVFSDDSINSDDITSFLALKRETANLDDFDLTVNDDSVSSHHSAVNNQGPSSLDVMGIDTNNEEGIDSLSCIHCSNTFQTKKQLVKHTMVYHSEENLNPKSTRIRFRNASYECEVCKKRFAHRNYLTKHLSVHEMKPSACERCGKHFSNRRYVLNHIKRVHLKIRNHPCDICGRHFTDSKTRSDHRRTHTGEKPFICEICGKAFSTHTCIYVHRRSHTDNFPHQCGTCGKCYRTRQGLQIHVRTHTGEVPYACDLCERRFKSKNQMHSHRQTHSTDKPHVCFLCGIGFTMKRYLTRHMVKHAELEQQNPVYANDAYKNPVYETL